MSKINYNLPTVNLMNSHPLRVAVTTQSKLKLEAIKQALDNSELANNYVLISINIDQILERHDAVDTQVPQPIDHVLMPERGNGIKALDNRIYWTLKDLNHEKNLNNEKITKPYDFIIGIENHLRKVSQSIYDITAVKVVDLRLNQAKRYEKIGFFPQYLRQSNMVKVSRPEIVQQLLTECPHSSGQGTMTTYGEVFTQQYNTDKSPEDQIQKDNWMKHVKGGYDRGEKISELLTKIMDDIRLNQSCVLDEIRNKLQVYDDFPKPGVKFVDWSNMFLDPHHINFLMSYLMRTKYKPYPISSSASTPSNHISYVIGLESRGFMLGVALANALKIGFVPMRKKGKLPGATLSATYEKEYGLDAFELRDDLTAGRVILVDDVLATGGSLRAAITLAERAGHSVVDCLVVKDVAPLRKKAKEMLAEYYSLVTILCQDE